jgi:hypothetical protein
MDGNPDPQVEREGTRAEIARALEGFMRPEHLDKLVEEVLEIKKGARGWCPKCKGAVMVEISDAKGVTGALTDLLNQSFGRPTETKQETEIIVERTVAFVCEHGHECRECTEAAGADQVEVPAE